MTESAEVHEWVLGAEALTRELLSDNPEWLYHSAAVAYRTQELSAAVDPGETHLLVASAWLHDLGYSSVIRDTGFHPLDGARHLRALGWAARVCDLVAHHSGSRFVAGVRGLSDELSELGGAQSAHGASEPIGAK